MHPSELEPVGLLTLRQATPRNCDFAYCAKKAAFKHYVEMVWGWDEREQRQLHEQRFATQDFRVINLDGTDVGIMSVALTSDCLRVNQLFLLPEHQGKGIGSRCMTLIAEEKRHQGLPVRLRGLKVNSRALAFFEGLGFTRAGETATHVLMENNP